MSMPRLVEIFTEEDKSLAKWREVFGLCHRQYEFALDTRLLLKPYNSSISYQDVIDAYIKYDGKMFRWINTKANMCGLLIVPVLDFDNMVDEYGTAMRLISRLVYDTGVPISIISDAGGPSRRLPILNQPYPLAFRISHIRDISENDTHALNLAYAFYKEGMNSNSIFYAFLSFWKVLHLAFEENKHRIRHWIGTNVSHVCSAENISDLQARAGSEHIADYLYASSRCAIAHTRLNHLVADPDNADDYRRIISDKYIVQDLAKNVIQTKAGILT